jgi:hypothetical protein
MRALMPAWWGDNSWDWWGNRVDVRVLERAASVAVTPEDRAWTRFFRGFSYFRWSGNVERQRIAPDSFAEIIALGKQTEWYDDALYYAAMFQEERGALRYHDGGGTSWAPDYPAAVALYRRLITEFRKGDTRFFDDATNRIKNITNVEVAVGVDRFFVPGSAVQFRLRWRNVKEVELALYPVDLTRDVRANDDGTSSFVARIGLARTAPAQRWTYTTGDEGRHERGDEALLVPEKPARGAYVLVARGGGQESAHSHNSRGRSPRRDGGTSTPNSSRTLLAMSPSGVLTGAAPVCFDSF